MRQQAEGIGIPLEEQEVLPASAFSPNELLPALTIAFLEVSADGTLPAVSEGRIAHVVSKAGCTDDRTDARAEGDLLSFGMAPR